jgi:ABC-type bacteriocin/lantibiotic exporter with double-glycine peptidase domain
MQVWRNVCRALLVGVLALAGLSCASVERTSRGESFASQYADFTYVELDAVRQSTQSACGAAALSALLNYWGKPVDQARLLALYPSVAKGGYPMIQLREMAKAQGLKAFVVSMKEHPGASLRAHLAKGRPLLLAVECPKGRYFGRPLPVIESFDSETVTPLGAKYKQHYLLVIGYSPAEWLVMDPAHGIVRVQKQDLMRFWRRMHYAAMVSSA